MKREKDIEKILQNSSHGKQKWYVIFNGPFRGIYNDWAIASTHVIRKSVSHKSYLTKEAAEKALGESYKIVTTEEVQKSQQFVSLNQHLQSQTAKLNAINKMKNIPTTSERKERRKPSVENFKGYGIVLSAMTIERKLIVPSVTIAQLGVSNQDYPSKNVNMEPTTPTHDDLALSLFRVFSGLLKIGPGPGQTDKVRINYYSKNLLIYLHLQEKINEVQIKALADFEDQFKTFSGLLAPLSEDLKQLLCGYISRTPRHHCYGEDDCCVFEVDVTGFGCLGVWVDVSMGSELRKPLMQLLYQDFYAEIDGPKPLQMMPVIMLVPNLILETNKRINVSTYVFSAIQNRDDSTESTDIGVLAFLIDNRIATA
nr:enzymatic polyprotein [Tanacetum cinerariifolium]